MSGLEGLSIAANVMQVVNFTGECYQKIQYFRGKYNDCFIEQFGDKLPLLKETLFSLAVFVNDPATGEEARAALKILVDGCDVQVQALKTKLEPLTRHEEDKKFKVVAKAFKAMWREGDLKKIDEDISNKLASLSQYQSTFVARKITTLDTSKFAERFSKQLEHEFTKLEEKSAKMNQAMLQQSKTTEDALRQQQQTLTSILTAFNAMQLKEPSYTPLVAEHGESTKITHFLKCLKSQYFVARPLLTQKIMYHLLTSSDETKRVALVGIGGQGKTQLAIDFCQGALRDGRFANIFWADATSEATVIKDFEKISRNLHPNREFSDVKSRIVAVINDLEELEDPWLFVFDNYDYPEKFRNLEEYMPPGDMGHFLITSRHQQSSSLCGGRSVGVTGMQKTEAVNLLLKRLQTSTPGVQISKEGAERIVTPLGFHALAIDQTAAYIKYRKLFDVDAFLKTYQEQKAKIHKYLPLDWKYKREDAAGEIKDIAVFATWELSFKQLEPDSDEGKRKAELLTLLAFLHGNQGVSESIFWAQDKALRAIDDYPAWLKHFIDEYGMWDHEEFGMVIAELLDKSLISSFTGDDPSNITNISLHPLVKEWIRLRLPQPERRRYAVEAVKMLYRFLQRNVSKAGSFEGMKPAEKDQALSYVSVCQEHCEEESRGPNPALHCHLGEGELVDAGELFAQFLLYVGKNDDSYRLFQTVIKSREKAAENENDLALLKSKSLSTEVLRAQKQFKEAEAIDRAVFEARKAILGENSEDTLWSAHDLGWDLEAIGNIEEAEIYQQLAADGRARLDTMGSQHPLTLQSLSNLAHLRRRQGRTLEALKIMEDVRRVAQVIYPNHHPETLLFTSNNLDILRFQGRLLEAKDLAEESYKGTCSEWDEAHPKSSSSRQQLKDIYWDLNDQKRALDVARENNRIMDGSPHSTDVSRVNDIALLIDVLSGMQMAEGVDRMDEIKPLARQALDLVQKIQKRADASRSLPETMQDQTLNLPSTIQDLIYLATGFECTKLSDELNELEPVILKSCESVFGVSDRNTVNSAIRLSNSLRNSATKLVSEAEKLRQKAAKLEHEENQYEAKRLRSEAKSKEVKAVSNTTKAKDLCDSFIKKLDDVKKELAQNPGPGSKTSLLAAMSWLAVLHKHAGNPTEAEALYIQAYDLVDEDDFIMNADYETLYSLQGLAEDMDDQKRLVDAEKLHKRVLKARRRKFERHPCIDDSLYALSWNLKLQGGRDLLIEAEAACKEAHEIALQFRGSHRNTVCILKRLAYIEEQLGKREEAEQHYREVLAGFEKLGTRHMTRVTEAYEDLQEILMEQGKFAEAKSFIEEAMKRRLQGWDKNPSHYAGLKRHLAIVTWNLGDSQEGLKLYREARKAYEDAWNVHDCPDPVKKEELIKRINELLPGTETMAEEERRKEELEAKEATEAEKRATEVARANVAAKQKADAENAQREKEAAERATAAAKVDIDETQQKINAKLDHYREARGSRPVSRGSTEAKAQSQQDAARQNEEAVIGNESLSRSTTLAVESDEQSRIGVTQFPDIPKHDPQEPTLNERLERLGIRVPAE